MAKKLNTNEAAYLQALEAEDPASESWIASWALSDKAKEFGADTLATSVEGAFAVLQKGLAKRKLVDKESARQSKVENGFSLNFDGRQALAAWREEQGLSEKDETE